VANCHSYTISVLLNKGDGSYANATHYGTSGFTLVACAADLDGDGDTDLAATNRHGVRSS